MTATHSVFDNKGWRTVQAEEIEDRESFGAWLNTRPESTRRQEAVTLAIRAALRAVPYLTESSKHAAGRDANFTLSVFRCNTVARLASSYRDREIEAAVVSTVSDVLHSAGVLSDDVLSAAAPASNLSAEDVSSSEVTIAGVSVAHAAAYAVLTAADNTVRAAFSAARAAADAALSASDAATVFAFWKQMRFEAKDIEVGRDLANMLASRLWQLELMNLHVKYRMLRLLLESTKMRELGFGIWSEWYGAVYAGKPVFDILNADIRETLERNIALGSTDGTFNQAFWSREPEDINADIARWVKEARQADVLAGSQRVGLKFKFQQGLIRLFPFYGLLAEGSNEARIRSQLPILRELVGSLKKKVGQLTPDDDPLLDALTGLHSAISCEPELIDASTLFTRTAVLRYHIEEANKNSGKPGVNLYVLSGGDMASAKGIALASDLVVLATKEGQALFDDADRAQLDAGQIDMLREVERKLLVLLTSEGSLMDMESQTLLKNLFDVQPTSPHPKRVFHAATASLQNAALVSVAVALGGTGLITLSPILAIAIGGVFGLYKATEMVAKGTPFGDTLDELRKEKVISFGKLLLDHEADIRAAAADRPSWKPVLDLLDRLKDQSKPKPK